MKRLSIYSVDPLTCWMWASQPNPDWWWSILALTTWGLLLEICDTTKTFGHDCRHLIHWLCRKNVEWLVDNVQTISWFIMWFECTEAWNEKIKHNSLSELIMCKFGLSSFNMHAVNIQRQAISALKDLKLCFTFILCIYSDDKLLVNVTRQWAS